MLNPAQSQRPVPYAGSPMGPFGHGDRVGGGPNGLDGLPGRLAAPAQGGSCFTTGESPGPRGQALLDPSRAPNHGRARV